MRRKLELQLWVFEKNDCLWLDWIFVSRDGVFVPICVLKGLVCELRVQMA